MKSETITQEQSDTRTVVQDLITPEQQATMPDAWYSWTFKADVGAPEQVFEFGMAKNELDAGNAIAKHLGVDALPDTAILGHTTIGADQHLRQVVSKKSAAKEAKDEAKQEAVKDEIIDAPSVG